MHGEVQQEEQQEMLRKKKEQQQFIDAWGEMSDGATVHGEEQKQLQLSER